ncbi:hypothetical protein PYW07_012485 [Mythimna separata]|uniref:PAP-associated domain-containing protein n=1 Tax=Mythimna separata TaxID=271217 RepID=A0AAD7YLA1_MYTSE|nr:hypothetical protein PYW07_012485 [Mythimna separata]
MHCARVLVLIVLVGLVQVHSFSWVCGVSVLAFCGSAVLSAPLSLAGDFDSQLQHILHEQTLTPQDPAISRALHDVRATLDQRWPGYELFLTGSLAAGLGIKASDIDVSIRLPHFNVSAGLYVLKETAKLFNEQPELYLEVKYRHDDGYNSTFLQCYHMPSERVVDIEFQTSGVDIFQVNLMKYYFNLDRRFQPLVVFLKYWFKVHDVTGHKIGYLPNFGVYMLIIFYLQQKNMAPPGDTLHIKWRPNYIEAWNLHFDELPYNTNNTENLHQLLGGFFKYYSEFNFEEYFVSPLTGRRIPKNALRDIDVLPEVYSLYHNTWDQTMLEEAMNGDMFIADFNGHHLNAGLISHERATKLKHLLKSAATMFEELPSDEFLSAILVMGDQETTINDNISTVDGISEQWS